MLANNVTRFASNIRSFLHNAEPVIYGTIALILISQILFVTGFVSWPEVLMVQAGIVLGTLAVCGASPVTRWLESYTTKLAPGPASNEGAVHVAILRTQFVRVAKILPLTGNRGRSGTNGAREAA